MNKFDKVVNAFIKILIIVFFGFWLVVEWCLSCTELKK